MITKTLYRYKREDGGITVSPERPSVKYETLYRLIADEGKILTDGSITTHCIDTETLYQWSEIDEPKQFEEE